MNTIQQQKAAKELEAHEVDKSHLPPPECMHTEYKGLSAEEINRLECAGSAWKYEDIWYHKSLESLDWSGPIQDYNIYGLSEFYLFNRYCHWGYTDPDGFRQWYKHTYHREEE